MSKIIKMSIIKNIKFIPKTILFVVIVLMGMGVVFFFNSCKIKPALPSGENSLLSLIVRDISGNRLVATINCCSAVFEDKASAGTVDVIIDSIVFSDKATSDKLVGDVLPVSDPSIRVISEDNTPRDYALSIIVAVPSSSTSPSPLSPLSPPSISISITPPPTPPTLTDLKTTGIGMNNVTVSTTYVAGNSVTTEYGFVYSSFISGSGLALNRNFVLRKKMGDGAPTSTSFSAVLGNLRSNILHYIRAYAISSLGIIYSDEISSVTAPTPLVLGSLSVSDITLVGATFTVPITSAGNLSVREYGVAYSTTLTGSALTSDLNTKIVETDMNSLESLTLQRNVFMAGSRYYARAYAVTSLGVVYSDNYVTFGSLDYTLVTLREVNLRYVRSPSSLIATVDYVPGNSAITKYGFVYSAITSSGLTVVAGNTSSNNIFIANNRGDITDDRFFQNLTNLENFEIGAPYYVRAYATNAAGTIYSGVQTVITPAPVAWTRVSAGASWAARNDFGLYSFSGQLWVVAGNFFSSSSPDVWTSSTDGTTWTEVTTLGSSWQGGNFGTAVHNGALWVIQEGRNNGLYKSVDGVNWTEASNLSRNSFGGIRSVVFNNHLYTTGGFTSGMNVIYRTLTGVRWEIVTTTPQFPARKSHGAVVFQNKIWVMGGVDGDTFFNDIWSSFDGRNWTSHGNAPWVARSGFATAVYDNKIWVIGGNTGSVFLNDVWWSSNGADWTQLPTGASHWSARVGLRATVFNNQLYMMGGINGVDFNLNDVWRLDLR